MGEGGAEIGASDLQRRTELANWLVGPENPWFAKAFVNRVWRVPWGVDLVSLSMKLESWGSRVAEVFGAVADHFIASEFDIKQLFRMIVLSKAYQLPLQETPRGWSKAVRRVVARATARRRSV